MDKKTLQLLKKIYHYENSEYNEKYQSSEYKIPASISQDDLASLESQDLLPNNFQTFSHDLALQKLISLKPHPKLTLPFVAAYFLKGVAGTFPRGRQPLMSYLYLRFLEPHPFTGKIHCETCGLPKKEVLDLTNEFFSNYQGRCWNEGSLIYLCDLEEILTLETPVVSAEEKSVLHDLLQFIAEAEPETTPGKLEKAIAKAKLLPKTDKYVRYGILQTLAECGILPQTAINPKYEGFVSLKELWDAENTYKTSLRSDIILPLAAWRGVNGVNFERYQEIFGNLSIK